ncbi:hypothetical protein G7Z17_g4730 [Cylindrodendrum hubeiense]|uniref:CHAT domain-containing protein n=1 Tax=Cylindrodendrum hubeiense TaxID=595255 RepID=A0A9P5H8C4_9HYPO|nr:hypothetical protein G7Z17_g4730 [Cylindrodendrum hubeiense]
MPPAVIKINVQARSSLPPNENRRGWNVDIKETHANEPYANLRKETQLHDPFPITEYFRYESAVQRSGLPSPQRDRSPSPGNLPSLREASIHSASASGILHDANSSADMPADIERSASHQGGAVSSVEEYRQTMHQTLGLDTVSLDDSIVKISISEDLNSKEHESSHYYSIHSLLWELLEHDDNDVHLAADAPLRVMRPGVQVTRWITGIPNPKHLPASLRCVEKPIRLLVVVARSLRRPHDQHFRDVQSVVVDTLFTVAKYLRQQGRHDRLSVDVVRPGTLAEFKAHLQRGKIYDMVHFDVHGWVQMPEGIPKLLFALPNGYKAPMSDMLELDDKTLDFVPVDEVATLLKQHNITAVTLSACLSSYAQGKPLSNMCRAFARCGVSAITGMSFTVKSHTAKVYFAAFYPALVLANCNFRTAAVYGRRWVQVQHQREALKRRKEREREREQREQRRQRRQRRSGSGSNATSNVPRIIIPNDEDQIWPAVTTYFATDHIDRTNSLRLGAEIFEGDRLEQNILRLMAVAVGALADPRFLFLVTTTLSLLVTFFFGWTSGILTFFAVILSWRQLSKVAISARMPDADLSGFEAFREKHEMPASHGIKHSIGLMVLEDRLKICKQLFIQVLPPGNNARLLALKDLWLTTNFADAVEIAPAALFKRQSLPFFYFHLTRHMLSRWYVTWKSWRNSNDKAAGRDPEAASPGDINSPPRTILIIEGFESIVKHGRPIYPDALARMNTYIKAVEARHPAGQYLIIMSRVEVGWWTPQWNVNEYPWTEAELFLARPGFTFIKARD